MMYPRSNGDALLFIQVSEGLYFLFLAYDGQVDINIGVCFNVAPGNEPAKAIV